ncbi:peptidylprolyl isomerase [Chromobacterium amazonense]|uniref:peptidylprolyl isomerase n=1 Tax=Chromobacterium amazonense TaxID=1382803 RepID=UPI0031F6A35A
MALHIGGMVRCGAVAEAGALKKDKGGQIRRNKKRFIWIQVLEMASRSQNALPNSIQYGMRRSGEIFQLPYAELDQSARGLCAANKAAQRAGAILQRESCGAVFMRRQESMERLVALAELRMRAWPGLLYRNGMNMMDGWPPRRFSAALPADGQSIQAALALLAGSGTMHLLQDNPNAYPDKETLMHKSSRLALTACLLALFAAPAAFAADAPVATVNGVAIPQSRMDLILKSQEEHGAKDSPELRQQIRDFLVTNEVLVQEAKKQGIDKSDSVKQELEMAQRGVLLNAFQQNFLKSNVISDDQLKAEYDRLKAATPSKEYHARHILVKTEKEANAILAQLKKGKSFDALAKAKSDDLGSKNSGGDLGWSDPGQYVKEFGDAMVALKPGEITQTPVKSQYGYHIIKLEGVREAEGPKFEDVKPQLQQEMQRTAFDKMIQDLKGKAKVE